ncbi:MAG: hypothetical protein FWD88_02795, partial [Treponema sp.]|nr:hypothetical protein [Treponema sp.]
NLAMAFDGGAYETRRRVTVTPDLWHAVNNPGGLRLTCGETYTLVLTVRDAADNETYIGNTLEFVFDDTLPELDILTVVTRPTQPEPPGGSITLAGHVTIRGETEKEHSPIHSISYALVPLGTLLGPGFDVAAGMTQGQLAALQWQDGDFVGGTSGDPIVALNAIRLEDNPSFNWTISIPNTRNITGNGAFAQVYAPAFRLAQPNGWYWGLGGDAVRVEGVPGLYWNRDRLGQGSTVHMVRLAVRAEDMAGNVGFDYWDFWLYPEGDRPTVEIRTPAAGLPAEYNRMSGRFTISGMARDNEHVHGVFFRVRQAVETPPDSGDFVPGAVIAMHVPEFDDAGMARPGTSQAVRTLAMLAQDYRNGWYMAGGGGSREAFWSAPVNDRGELNAPGARGMNRVFVEVVALDATRSSPAEPWDPANQMASDVYVSEAIVITGAPVFTPVAGSSEFRPAVGTLEQVHLGRNSGNAIFMFEVTHESGISAIRYQRTDPTTRTPTGSVINLLGPDSFVADLWPGGGGGVVPGGRDTYGGITVSATLPTLRAGEWVSTVTVEFNIGTAPGAGVFDFAHLHTGDNIRFPVFISAADNSEPFPIAAPNNELAFGIVVDNGPPTARHEHNPVIAGASAPLGGSAFDSGGIGRVVVWFENRAGAGVSWTGAPGFAWDGYVTVPNPGGNGTRQQRLPFVPGHNAVTGGDYAIIVDRNAPMGAAHHGHWINTGWATGGMGQLWNFTFDSRRLPSGPLTMHYVVFDRAGNANHFTQRVSVMNHAPWIDRVQLATDLRGRHSVAGVQRDVLGDISGAGGNNIATNTHPGIFDAIRTAFFGPSAIDDDVTNIRSGITPARNPVSQAGMLTQSGRPGIGARLNIENFTARNDFLAVGVSTLQEPGPGITERRIGVQYVSSIGNPIPATGVVAGRVYVIANPSDVDWRMLGTQHSVAGGYAFLAVNPGSELPDSAGLAYATVMELNPADSGPTVMPVHLWESGAGLDGDRAEFAFRYGAFGPAGIADYDHGDTDQAWLRRLNRYALFIVTVVDGPVEDVFADFTLLEVRVNNDDQTMPFAQLHDLNPAAEIHVFAGDAIPAGIAPAARADGLFGQIADNRTRGGLWRTATDGNASRPGNIEPRRIVPPHGTPSSSPYVRWNHSLGPDEMDPHRCPLTSVNPNAFLEHDTVSGRVVLRGYAEDDQRIDRVVLYFAGADVPTGSHVVILERADWDAGAATPGRTGLLQTQRNDVTFADTIDLYRHRVEWAFVWDTAAVPVGFVVGDLRVRAVAYNAAATAIPSPEMSWETGRERQAIADSIFDARVRNPGFPPELYRYNSIRVNIRPYITGFMRNDSLGFSNTRSMQGRYAFHRGEGVVLTGFNIGGGGTSATDIFLNTRTAGASIAGAVTRTAVPTHGPGANWPANTVESFLLPGAPGVPGTTTADRFRHFVIPANAVTGDHPDATGADSGGRVHLRVTRGAAGFWAVNTGAVTAAGVVTGERRRNLPDTQIDFAPRMINNGWWTQPWNTEWSTGTIGSDLWDNVTAMHVWQSDNAGLPGGAGAAQDRGGFAVSGGDGGWVIYGASMSIDPVTGILISSHNEGGSAAGGGTGTSTSGFTRISRNTSPNTTTANTTVGWLPTNATITDANPARIGSGGRVTEFIDPIIHSSVFVNTLGQPWVASSIIGRQGHTEGWGGLGGVFVHGPRGGSWTTAAVSAASNADSNSSLYAVESLWYNASRQNLENWAAGQITPANEQFRNPRVVTQRFGSGANDERIHVAYFDSQTGAIKYRFNQRNEHGGIAFGLGDIQSTSNVTSLIAPAAALDARRLWTTLDGGYDADDIRGAGAGIAAGNWFTTALATTLGNNRGENRARLVPAGNFRGSISRSGGVGQHNDIAVTREGFPVIVYFDAESESLRIAVSNSVMPVAGADWNIFEVFSGPGGDDNPRAFGTGQYVGMRIDTNAGATQDTVHISAFNAITNNLVYIRGRIEAVGTARNWVFDHAVVVDSVGRNVGRRSTISLDRHGNPWIAYLDNSMIGSTAGVKVAFLNAGVFARSGDARRLEDIYGLGATRAGQTRLCGDLTGWETMHVPAAFRVVDDNHPLWN